MISYRMVVYEGSNRKQMGRAMMAWLEVVREDMQNNVATLSSST